MSVFSVKKDGDKLEIINNTPKKVLLRLVIIEYEVTAITHELERIPKVVHDELNIEKELNQNEKIEIKTAIENVKKVILIYKDLENNVTLREEHEI